MLHNVFFVETNDELQIYDYFTREFVSNFKIGEKIKIECYDEMVYLSGELQKNTITNQFYLCDRNGFICYIEYGQVYEKVWLNQN